MPFNLLLLPLLAGYLYLTRSNMRRYSLALLQKEQLLLSAATFGLIFLLVSRLIVVCLLSTSAGRWLGELVHKVAPFPYVGTSLGAVCVAFVGWRSSNFFVSESLAGLWLYNSKKFDQFTRIFWHGAIGVPPREVPGPMLFTVKSAYLFIDAFFSQIFAVWRRKPSLLLNRPRRIIRRRYLRVRQSMAVMHGLAGGTAKPVMIYLTDSKVITGFVDDMPAASAISDHVTIVPLWTGYRDKESRRLFKTTSYVEAYLRLAGAANDLKRVIRLSDIASVTIFRESAFELQEDAMVIGNGGPAQSPQSMRPAPSPTQP